jgi:mono/diheme cytochrome c family protein
MIGDYLSPAETRRLASALMGVLGFIALVALLAFLIVPSLRYQADPDRGGPGGDGLVNPVLGETGWLDPTDTPAKRTQVLSPIDPKTVMTPTPALLEQGKARFAQECATCHGPAGKGDGPAGLGLTPRPRDFTAKDGWKNGPRLDAIYKTLDAGIPDSGMGSFNYLGKRERMALAHYVQSLGAFDHGSDPAALAALAHQFSTSGETIPNRIPVQAAEAALCREYAATHPSP